MSRIYSKILSFAGMSGFKLVINRLALFGEEIIVNNQHTHNMCEIYLNLSGNVSFMVENNIYPISPGNIIITRPFEAHHCIYHSKEQHDHIWILFSAEDNERFFDLFYKREPGEKNLIILTSDHLSDFINICRILTEKEVGEFEKYSLFFRLMAILNSGNRQNISDNRIKKEILTAISYINDNISGDLSVSLIAKRLNLNVKTFERYFREGIGMLPARYIRSRRLSAAKTCLAEGLNVSQTAEKCGFSDYSLFISSFKRTYGITPLKFKKSLENENRAPQNHI